MLHERDPTEPIAFLKAYIVTCYLPGKCINFLIKFEI